MDGRVSIRHIDPSTPFPREEFRLPLCLPSFVNGISCATKVLSRCSFLRARGVERVLSENSRRRSDTYPLTHSPSLLPKEGPRKEPFRLLHRLLGHNARSHPKLSSLTFQSSTGNTLREKNLVEIRKGRQGHLFGKSHRTENGFWHGGSF